MTGEGIEFFERTAEQLTAAIFSTELGWMTCIWRGELLERNSFGHTSRAAAWAAIQSVKATTFGARRAKNVADSPFGTWRDGASFAAAESLVERLQRYAVEFADTFPEVVLNDHQVPRFARRVLQECRRIPLGETLTYQELARRAGSPGAARAVGNTMARNRFPLIVPCHRVVGANGHLGGYSAPQGLTMKRRLLAAEARTREMASVS